MIRFTGKAAKALLFSTVTALMLSASAMAAEGDLAVGAGVTTGSSLRLRAEASTSSSIITMLNKDVTLAVLDTSTSGMIAKRTKDAMIAYIEERFENGLDGAKLHENFAFGDGLRETAAKLFNADSEEIFFGEAASTMINVFSAGVLLKENANVVTSGLTFPSTPYTWMNRVGVENVRIAKPVDGKMPPENLFALVDENTAVLSLCLVEIPPVLSMT